MMRCRLLVLCCAIATVLQMTLNLILLQREFSAEEDERRRINRITQTIDTVLNGEARLGCYRTSLERFARRTGNDREISIGNDLIEALAHFRKRRHALDDVVDGGIHREAPLHRARVQRVV